MLDSRQLIALVCLGLIAVGIAMSFAVLDVVAVLPVVTALLAAGLVSRIEHIDRTPLYRSERLRFSLVLRGPPTH